MPHAQALARWQVALVALAVAALAAYALSTMAVSREHWPDIWMGDRMRLNALVSLAAGAAMAAGLIGGLPLLILLGGAAALAAALQQTASIGWVPSLVLPWAVSLTGGAMLVAADRLGRRYVVGTVGGLLAFGTALIVTRAWASLDFVVAAFGTLLAWALLDLAWRAIRRAPLP
jgi:hypothetical protein